MLLRIFLSQHARSDPLFVQHQERGHSCPRLADRNVGTSTMIIEESRPTGKPATPKPGARTFLSAAGRQECRPSDDSLSAFATGHFCPSRQECRHSCYGIVVFAVGPGNRPLLSVSSFLSTVGRQESLPASGGSILLLWHCCFRCRLRQQTAFPRLVKNVCPAGLLISPKKQNFRSGLRRGWQGLSARGPRRRRR